MRFPQQTPDCSDFDVMLAGEDALARKILSL